VLEAADRGVRDRLARSGGEAPAHDLVAYIEEQFGEHTGERRTVRKALEKLIVHVSYASRGRFTPFDESIDPELFAEEMTSMHEGEKFRAQFLLDKIEQILPTGRQVEQYLRDRHAGTLVPYNPPSPAAAAAETPAPDPHLQATLLPGFQPVAGERGHTVILVYSVVALNVLCLRECSRHTQVRKKGGRPKTSGVVELLKC